MSRCSVLLAEGRVVRAGRLAGVLSEGGGIGVAGVAHSLTEAYHLTESLAPDAVAISADLAVRPEFPMFRALLEAMGIRPLIYSTARVPEQPQLAGIEQVVLRHEGDAGAIEARLRSARPVEVPGPGRPLPLVVIGASTGGIEAIETILAGLPSDCPPILIVQHIRGEFSASVAARLDRAGPMEVREAADGLALRPGCALLAPGSSLHLEVIGRHALRCRLRAGPPVSGHRPSIDVLFRSAAGQGRLAIGALLTGMGRDGAEGLLAIRRAGGRTFAQDRASCVVHGMPRVACEIGAVERELPLQRIASAIVTASAEVRRTPSEEYPG